MYYKLPPPEEASKSSGNWWNLTSQNVQLIRFRFLFLRQRNDQSGFF